MKGLGATRRPAEVLVLTASGPEIGYGHVIRVRALLEELNVAADVYGEGDAARFFPAGIFRRADDLGAMMGSGRPTVLIVDLPESRHWTSFVELPDVLVVAINDAGGPALRADIVVNGSGFPGYHQYPSLSQTAIVRTGLKYALLRRDFRDLTPHDGPRAGVAIVAGSSSPVQEWVGRLIAHGLPSRWGPIVLVVSPACPAALVRKARGEGVDIRRGLTASELIDSIRTKRLCVTTAGMTMIEAFSAGVPVAAYPAQSNMVAECRHYHEQRWLVDLGGDAAVPERLVEMVDELLERPSLLDMARTVRRSVDGRGALRVAALVERAAEAFGLTRSKCDSLAAVAQASDVLQD